MSNDNELFYRRAFLNEGRGPAMVEAQVNDNSWTDKTSGDRRASFDGTLTITDCSRSVSLDACFSDIEGARNVLRKLDRLSDAIQGMRDAMGRAARREWPGKKL